MQEYLGEVPVTSLEGTPFQGFGPKEWALKYIEQYGWIDGDHHKTWLLDQIARIMHGTPIEVVLARWSDGQTEYRYSTGEPSIEYRTWVKEVKGVIDPETGETERDYYEGIAP